MKIYAVIRNYDAGGAKSSVFGDGDPCWYTMPDSSILKTGNPFFVPDFDDRFLAFPSIVYRIGRLGKSISTRFAHRYLDSWTIGVAVVATETLKRLRDRGLPWCEAVSFDRSCLLGNLQPINTLINNEVIRISCGSSEMNYDISDLKKSPYEIIERLSRTNTLKNGDFILSGLTPEGLKLEPGMKLTARHETLNTNIIDINIR